MPPPIYQLQTRLYRTVSNINMLSSTKDARAIWQGKVEIYNLKRVKDNKNDFKRRKKSHFKSNRNNTKKCSAQENGKRN
jgi:hypothetical protein